MRRASVIAVLILAWSMQVHEGNTQTRTSNQTINVYVSSDISWLPKGDRQKMTARMAKLCIEESGKFGIITASPPVNSLAALQDPYPSCRDATFRWELSQLDAIEGALAKAVSWTSIAKRESVELTKEITSTVSATDTPIQIFFRSTEDATEQYLIFYKQSPLGTGGILTLGALQSHLAIPAEAFDQTQAMLSFLRSAKKSLDENAKKEALFR